ncbi:MAG: TIGR02281 family clan AA aspartic protease [Methylobacter sp.]|nr:MAG: TIGR02281 family clan AA aspartic protease [Methylobacter sp.]
MDKFRVLIIILGILATAGRAYIAYNRNYEPQAINPPPPIAQNYDNGLTNRDIVFRKDYTGHFRGTMLVNGVAMPFLIDTGATTTSIPLHLARQAKLTVNGTGLISTANGVITVFETEIESLKIDKAEINNSEALILNNLDQPLLGMNILQMFVITTKGDTMTLTAGNFVKITEPANELVGDENGIEQVSAATIQPYKPRVEDKKWKRTVTCDNDGKNCKTAYSH